MRRARHAEIYAFDKLNEKIENYKSGGRITVKIKFYINMNSTPCTKCANSIISFKEHWEHTCNCKVKLKIVFSSLYNVQRESCRKNWCRHKQPKDKDHNLNLKGITKLKQSGIDLAVFENTDWELIKGKLLEELAENWTKDLKQREQEDKNLKRDLEFLLQ